MCQGCLRGAEVSKRQLLSTVLSRMPTSGVTGRMQAGGDLRKSRFELDEAPELLTVEDSEDEEGEEVAEEEGKDIVEVYGGDSGVGDVVRKVATKMGLQRGQGYEVKQKSRRPRGGSSSAPQEEMLLQEGEALTVRSLYR